MKRLNCTYEAKKDPVYPWLLKHPKIKNGLAKFKTRAEALEWYMLLNFETAIWFQDSKRIFDGQLTLDDHDNRWHYYVKVAGFSGEGTYEGICRELNIAPFTFEHDNEEASKRLKDLDFVLISDPYTYFPADLENSKRKPKDYVDMTEVEAIKTQYELEINSLKNQLDEAKVQEELAKKEIEELEEELEAKEEVVEEVEEAMNDEIVEEHDELIEDEVQEELAEEEIENEEEKIEELEAKEEVSEEVEEAMNDEIVEEHDELIEEEPVEEVVEEVMEEVEEELVLESVEYVPFNTLNESDTVGAIVLNMEKLDHIANSLQDVAISDEDYKRIKFNFWALQSSIQHNLQKIKGFGAEVVTKLNEQLLEKSQALLSKLTVDETLEDLPVNQAHYISHKTGKNVSVAWETSFILVDLKHVGFVEFNDYHYSIPELSIRNTYSITLINGDDRTQTITYESGKRIQRYIETEEIITETEEYEVEEPIEEPVILEEVVEEIVEEQPEEIIEEVVEEEIIEEQPEEIVEEVIEEPIEEVVEEEIVEEQPEATEIVYSESKPEVIMVEYINKPENKIIEVIQSEANVPAHKPSWRLYHWAIAILVILIIALLVVAGFAITDLVTGSSYLGL